MSRGILVPTVWLALLHVAVIGADFFAPYDYTLQNRSMPFAPPTRVHFVDPDSRFPSRPFVCQWTPATGGATYVEDCGRKFPIHFLVTGSPYHVASLLEFRRRLFGVQTPGVVYLMGSDDYGRDQLSRFLHGGRVSLFAGLLACGISLGIGLLLGAAAGFYRGRLDGLIMGAAELSLALPWLYLLLAARAILPLNTDPSSAFLLIVALVGIVGWARPARLIRGTVLSAREREYVVVSRGLGASDWHLLRRHVLPQLRGLLVTQASLLIPRYILAEVTLSFLGLGVNEPAASWGNMLSILQRYHVLVSYNWMFFPALLLVPTFLSYLALTAACTSNNQS